MPINRKSVPDALKSSELFSQMRPDLLDSVAQVAFAREVKAGEMLFFQNQEAKGFYLIANGAVRIFRTGTDGREQLMHLFGDGEVVGEVPVFQGSVYPANAAAHTDSRLIYFRHNDFRELGRKQPEILLSLLAILSKRLRHFVDLVDDLSLKDVNARLAGYILKNACDRRATHVLPISKSALASRLGTISATLSRALKKMQRQGAIKVDGSVITILDHGLLSGIAFGDKFRGD